MREESLTEDLGDVGVVHVGARLQDLPPLVLGPDHERVHRPLRARCEDFQADFRFPFTSKSKLFAKIN